MKNFSTLKCAEGYKKSPSALPLLRQLALVRGFRRWEESALGLFLQVLLLGLPLGLVGLEVVTEVHRLAPFSLFLYL